MVHIHNVAQGYMSVQTEGARRYLNIDIRAHPDEAQNPVPEDRIENLNFDSTCLPGYPGRPNKHNA